MSNKIRPWRKKDRKHFKHKVRSVKGKKPPPIKALVETQQFEAASYEYDDPTMILK